MAVGILRHTIQFVDNLTPEHSQVLTDWLSAGDGLLIERDDKRQLVTYHLDHPDFSGPEGSEYQLSFARDRITQDIFVVNLMGKDVSGALRVVRYYSVEDRRKQHLDTLRRHHVLTDASAEQVSDDHSRTDVDA